MVSELRSADTYCRYLANRHYENFSVASIFLPRDLRLHLARIYAYCRSTDDLGDESGFEAQNRLTRWKAQVDDLFDGGPRPVHPVLLAVRETVQRFHLARRPFIDLIDANLHDQQVTHYETWEELQGYCTLSAAPVGRMVLGVCEIHDPAAVPLSDDVCIGLQLANFAQDVRVDRQKGRTYLLQSDVRAGGVPAAVRALCDRAEALLASGEQLETLVPGLMRTQLALYRLGGKAIVSAIRRMDYRTDLERPTVPAITKLRLLPPAAIRSRGEKRHVEKLRTPAV